MNPLDVQNDIREFDILMHGGAPQVPAPVFGRGQNAFRQGRTARAAPVDLFEGDGIEDETLYYIVFDCTTGVFSMKPVGQVPESL